MTVLETTFLIDILRGKEKVRTLKDELDNTETTLFIAAPSLMELWLGAALSQLPTREQQKINELLESLNVLPLDEKSAKEAGDIEAELTKKGSLIQTEDIMIAGIVRANTEKLVTRDEGYARIPGLRLIKY